VVDDPDVPTDPDDRTRAEAEAARGGRVRPADTVAVASAARRTRGGPRGVLLLGLVIVGVLGLGVYAVYWSDQLRMKNERIRLRELERRHVMAQWQQRYKVLRFGPDADVQPPGVVYAPLAPADRAAYESYIKQYGSQFEPNDLERALIEDAKRLQAQYAPPATGPATSP
jgi:hypothetical protein